MTLQEAFGDNKRHYKLTPVGITIYIPVKEPIKVNKIILDAKSHYPNKKFNLDGFVEVPDEHTEETLVYLLPFQK